MENNEGERVKVLVPVKRIQKQLEAEQPKPIETLPDGWWKHQTEIRRRWQV